MEQKRNGWKFSFDQGICPKIREKYTFVRACPKRTVIHINGSHKVIILFHENCSFSYIYDIYMCVRSSPVSSSPCIKSTMRTTGRNGRKNYSWTSKIKMDTVRGWNFLSINFYRTKIVPWNSLLFAVILHIFNLFFFIYISFFLSYSVPSLHFQSSRSFRIGYFSPRKNVPGITVCNDNSETTILSIAALEKRRFLFIFSLFFSSFSFFYFNRLSRIGRPLLSITKCISSSSMRSCRYIYILDGLELSWRKIDSMTHVRLI